MKRKRQKRYTMSNIKALKLSIVTFIFVLLVYLFSMDTMDYDLDSQQDRVMQRVINLDEIRDLDTLDKVVITSLPSNVITPLPSTPLSPQPSGSPVSSEAERQAELRRYLQVRVSVEQLVAGMPFPRNASIHIHTGTEAALLPPHPLGKRFPQVLIVGVRKGGTSALRDFIALHPHIRAPLHEPGFFFRDNAYTRGLEWYREKLPRLRSKQMILIEKSAEYFHYWNVPERAYAFNSSMKILLIVRDPFIRMVSDYLFMKRYLKKQGALEKKFSIEELLYNATSNQLNTQWGCLKRSVYYLYFAQWLKYFPRDQILVIDGDDFAENNPGRELQRVEQFLGIHTWLTESRFYYNQTKGFYCVTMLGCLNDGKGHQHPPIHPVLENKVRQYLKPYNSMFYKQVGHDFGWL